MKKRKLVSMVDYILDIDFMTTMEFCQESGAPLPTIKGGVDSFLQIDAIKHRMFVEYAKFLKKPLEISMFFPFEDGKVMLEDAINFERGIKFKDAKDKCLFYEFWLKGNYQTPMMTIHFQDVFNVAWWDNVTQVWELSKGLKTIGDLVNYGLEYNEK